MNGLIGYFSVFVYKNSVHKKTIKEPRMKKQYLLGLLCMTSTVFGINPRDAALIAAAMDGRADDVQNLLAAHANANAVSNDGTTALIMASEKGHAAVVRLLLAAHANVNATDNSGTTALIIAVAHGYVGVVQSLLAARANVNAARNDGATALTFAVLSKRGDIIGLLRKAGAR
jgi:ankyrin repeat protein